MTSQKKLINIEVGFSYTELALYTLMPRILQISNHIWTISAQEWPICAPKNHQLCGINLEIGLEFYKSAIISGQFQPKNVL